MISVTIGVDGLPLPTPAYTLLVYAIRFDGYPSKIGISGDLRKRIRSIKAEHSRFGISSKIDAVAYSEPCFNAPILERALLGSFERLSGEYVAADFSDIVEAMRALDYATEASDDQRAAHEQSAAFFNALTAPIKRAVSVINENEKLAKVEEAIRLFGPKAGAQLWVKLGLDWVPAMADVLAQDSLSVH